MSTPWKQRGGSALKYLCLPWSAKVPNLFVGENKQSCNGWTQIQYILQSQEARDVNDSTGFVQVMQALLYRSQQKENFGFESLVAAVNQRMTSEERQNFFATTLPKMMKLVLDGPEILPEIEVLTKGSSQVYLSQKQAGLLLACSFFSLFTLPKNYEQKFWFLDDARFHAANMCSLFCCPASLSQSSKAYAYLLYFDELLSRSNDELSNHYIRLSRSLMSADNNLSRSSKPLTTVAFTKQLIEEQSDASQMIFANKRIGGGVLRKGCVQEEIRLVVCPELLTALVLCEEMGDTESVSCEGACQYVSYSGYSRTFTVNGKYYGEQCPSVQLKDVPNGVMSSSSVVWMDATNFRNLKPGIQFSKAYVDRELVKALACFSSVSQPLFEVGPVATGNWGCGAFCGDVKLKFLIQWCAAAESDRKVVYCLFDQAESLFTAVYHKLVEEQWTVGKLYQKITQFDGQTNDKNIFQFLLSS